MSYRIMKPRKPPKTGEDAIETHSDPKAAMRACLIMGAHEILNGRVADYRVEPPTFCKAEELNLPNWVKEILFKDDP